MSCVETTMTCNDTGVDEMSIFHTLFSVYYACALKGQVADSKGKTSPVMPSFTDNLEFKAKTC